MIGTSPVTDVRVSVDVLDELSRRAEQVCARSRTLCQAAARAGQRASTARLSSRPRDQYARLDGLVEGARRPIVVYRDGTVRADASLLRRFGLVAAVDAVFQPTPPTSSAGADQGPLGLAVRLARFYDDLWRFDIFDACTGSVHAVTTAEVPAPSCPLPAEPPGDLVRLAVQGAEEGPVVHVHVRGEVDLLVADRVRSLLAATTAPIVVVDLSQLSFMDVAGLRALCSAKRDAGRRGIRLRLVGASGIVRRVFEVCGLAGELDTDG